VQFEGENVRLKPTYIDRKLTNRPYVRANLKIPEIFGSNREPLQRTPTPVRHHLPENHDQQTCNQDPCDTFLISFFRHPSVVFPLPHLIGITPSEWPTRSLALEKKKNLLKKLSPHPPLRPTLASFALKVPIPFSIPEKMRFNAKAQRPQS